MSPVVSAAQTPTRTPTPDAPDYGVIGYRELIVSHVAYWVEAGDHVFRSTEFDVIAGAKDFKTAICEFVEKAEDYANYLAELVEHDEATQEEAETAVALLERFAQLYRAEKERLEEQSRQLVRINLRRRRRSNHPRAGYEQSPRENSSRLQPA